MNSAAKEMIEIKFGTKLIHNGYEIDKSTGALSVPIYQVSTFHQDMDKPGEYDYSRSGNPTRKALEETVALLEGGAKGFAFSSGMAATSSVLSIFSKGDHIIICEDVYGGTFRIAKKLFERFGFEITFVNAADVENIRNAVKSNTKAVFLETPSNPLLKITDLKGAAAISREHNLLVVVDNTFMSPYLQRPLEVGADIVIHSATKFIGGHSDVIGGLVVVKDKALAERVYFIQNGFGAILGPQDSWLLLRGIKTLKVRLDYQQRSAMALADFLKSHKGVARVFYPGLDDHEGGEVHFSQADGAGAVLSFTTADVSKAREFMRKVKTAAVAVSLGGVETIVSHPARMSHASMPAAERERLGIADNLVRVSVGLEEIEDLLEDFSQALD